MSKKLLASEELDEDEEFDEGVDDLELDEI